MFVRRRKWPFVNHLIIIIVHTRPSPRQVAGIVVFGVVAAAVDIAAADIAAAAVVGTAGILVGVAGIGLRYWENIVAARRCILVWVWAGRLRMAVVAWGERRGTQLAVSTSHSSRQQRWRQQ